MSGARTFPPVLTCRMRCSATATLIRCTSCTNSAACYCYGSKLCAGCNACRGIVFHCEDGKECAIYNCCVTVHGYKSCGECGEVPCGIWQKTRDPKFTDEEFETNVSERLRGWEGKTASDG